MSRRHGSPRRPAGGAARRRAAVAVAVLVLGALLGAAGIDRATALPVQTPTTVPTTEGPTTTRPGSTTTIAPTTSTTAVPPSSTTSTATSTTSTTLAPGVLVPPPTIPPSQLDELKKLQDDYEGATADEIDLLKRFIQAQEQADDLAGQVDRLNASLGSITRDLATAQRKVTQADAAARAADAKVLQGQRQLADEQARLRAQAVEAYIGGGVGGGNASANAIMRSGTVDDLGKTLVYSDVVVAEQRATVTHVGELRAQLDVLQAQADDARDAAVAARDAVAAQQRQVQTQLTESQRLRASVKQTSDQVKQLIDEVAKKREEYTARINVLTRVSDGISETLRKAEEGETLPLNTAGIFISPIPNPVFTSPFGPRVDPLLGAGAARMHNGVDINGTTGTPIRAPADGVVLIAGEVDGYGNCTVIDHGSGLGTLYGHQSKFNVQVGDVVKKGDIIGFVGSTGHSTGPHLHWEVREFGQPKDPIPFIGPG